MSGLLVVSTTVLAAAYKAGPRGPLADFTIDAESDSSGTTMITLHAMAHANAECEPNKLGGKLGHDMTSGNTPALKPMRIAAGETFAFTATYGEARMGETRSCSLTAAFTPLPDHRYVAHVVAKNQVSDCSMGVYDVTDGTAQFVDFHMPAFVCGKKQASRQPNGKPVRKNMRIVVWPSFEP